MIHFDVVNEDGDRTLYLEGTRTLVGEIVQGRKMTDLRSNWTEWRFEPAEGARDAYPIHKAIAGAYENAREYAATLVGAS